MIEDLRALTLRQPWASLVMLDHPDRKDVENRTWPTRYRGPLVIHAGRGRDREGNEHAARFGLDVAALPSGVCLGFVDLRDVVRDHPGPWAIPGHWHWLIERPQLFPEPVRARGQFSLWRPPMSVVEAARQFGG